MLVSRVQGVGGVQPLREPRQVRPGRPGQQVEMVVHQHEAVEHNPGRMDGVAKLGQEPLPVLVRPEDPLPAVAAAGHVVEGIGEVNSGRSCHVPQYSPPGRARKGCLQLTVKV